MDKIRWLERRTVLMHIAEKRRVDARVLLRNKRYDGAVYLGGYVIECMLKGAICQFIGEERLPERYMTHELEWLCQQAALVIPPNLWHSWQEVAGWDVHVRYSSYSVNAQDAREFIDAMEVIREWLLDEIRERERR